MRNLIFFFAFYALSSTVVVANASAQLKDVITAIETISGHSLDITTQLRATLTQPRYATNDERIQIANIYKSRDYKPHWTSGAQLNANGIALKALFENAHLYGLRNKDYAIPSPPNTQDFTYWTDLELRITELSLTYARHAMQGRVNPNKVHPYITPSRPNVNIEDVLKTLFEVSAPAYALQLYHPPHEGFARLQKQLHTLVEQNLPSNAVQIADIVANMERWRWLPRDLGNSYIWANIPSYMVQVKTLDETRFETRTVVGSAKNPTPVFSHVMDHLIVNPTWHVPSSIATKELLPALKRDPNAIARKGLQMVALSNGKAVDPLTIDWANVNENRLPFAFRQPPSERNALGKIKFMFPNQHAVYMHDTPLKQYFQHTRRAYSHGCVRIYEPLKFADAVLFGDEQWNSEKLQRLFGSSERRIDLKTPLPVHIVYFTLEVDDSGTLKRLEDPYGYHKSLKSLMM